MKSRRSPRATFLAASFVVTAATGCATTTQDVQPTSNPPGPTMTAPPGQPPPTGPTAVGPMGSPNHIEKRPDGSCVELANTHCPPGASCNPPPPKKVACPPGM